MLFPLTFSIILTIIVFLLIPFILNYILLYNNIPYGFILLFLINYIVSFIFGYFISYFSGLTKCNNTNYKVSLWRGFKQANISTIVYIIIFYIPLFKSGFIEILGDTFYSNSFAEAFILILSNISLTIDNYFLSLTEQCKLNFKLSAAAWNKIEKKLNSKKKKIY